MKTRGRRYVVPGLIRVTKANGAEALIHPDDLDPEGPWMAVVEDADTEQDQEADEPQGTPGEPEDTSDEVEDTEEDEADEEAGDYASWTGAEMKEECRQRNIPVSGSRAELIERLESDDSANAGDEEE